MADDKGETMITINSTDLLSLLGENGERWVQGEWGDENAMCLHGAIRRCSPQPGDAFIIEQVANRQGWGTEWNDSDGTDWSMVRERIMAGIEVSDEMLADTFGPEWEHIVALVRRTAVLTFDEASLLDAAWDAAGDAAWGAAWDAARDAAVDAAWDAARDAAWYAAWGAAGDAARGAACALSVRDLIGQHGFSQEDYDALTGPWSSVIGPVHPEDEARRG